MAVITRGVCVHACCARCVCVCVQTCMLGDGEGGRGGAGNLDSKALLKIVRVLPIGTKRFSSRKVI